MQQTHIFKNHIAEKMKSMGCHNFAKFSLLAYNITSWVSLVLDRKYITLISSSQVGSLAFISLGMWAWTEKGYISGFTQMVTFSIDPASFVIVLGCMIFLITFCGAIGALRENIRVLAIVCYAFQYCMFCVLVLYIYALAMQKHLIFTKFNEI